MGDRCPVHTVPRHVITVTVKNDAIVGVSWTQDPEGFSEAINEKHASLLRGR